MKYGYLLAGLLGLGVANASAVELNTEALKKMQEEGLKILNEQQDLRTLGLPNGQCLQVAGAPDKPGTNVVLRKCADKVKQQQWRFDDKGRLLSSSGLCLALADGKQATKNALLKNCQGSQDQKWALDKASRLVNGLGQCLQGANGNAVSAACGNAGNQKWK